MHTKGTDTPYQSLNNNGYYRLVSAIIYSAFEDACITDKEIKKSANEKIKLNRIRYRNSAIRFFNSITFKNYCDLIDLNPEYVYRLLKEEFKRRQEKE